MLLSLRHKAWQITDFGLTHEGASGISIVTGFSRGSEGYRGPELIKERSVVAQQTDIFALGCTLTEVITGKQLFPHDFDVFQYMYTGKLPETPSLEVDKRSKIYVSELLKAMLDLNWRKRPSTSDILEEIGNPEINWKISLMNREKEMGYPSEDNLAWCHMRWKPYWYVYSHIVTDLESQKCNRVAIDVINRPLPAPWASQSGFSCQCLFLTDQVHKWRFVLCQENDSGAVKLSTNEDNGKSDNNLRNC